MGRGRRSAARVLAHVRGQWMGALALLMVLTTGTAVALDGKNSVKSDDIARGQVRSEDVRNDALGGDKIRDRTLSAADIKPDSLTGEEIAESTLVVPVAGTAQRADIADNISASLITSRYSDLQSVDPGLEAFATALCLPGETPVGGGGSWVPSDAGTIDESYAAGTGWRVRMYNATDQTARFQAQAICLKVK